jgi:hypothetical protein
VGSLNAQIEPAALLFTSNELTHPSWAGWTRRIAPNFEPTGRRPPARTRQYCYLRDGRPGAPLPAPLLNAPLL